ncbi:MAG TPA: DNA repair protein RecO, partial [Candidatus Nitrosopolaris sp.]|nr:DNA repair protein RecO [Candidatus Nitrosopolaris sp.]
MKQFTTQGIVLTRTDFGEADRIITFLTPDHGKVRAIAKAVRKSQSKLAGGIELFSVSNLTFVAGRGELHTLISSRLDKHYAGIVKDLGRTNAAYELIKLVNKATEEKNESGYFDVLHQAFAALDDSAVDPQITELWCRLRVLDLAGHAPNLQNGPDGQKLPPAKTYNFDFEHMCFAPADAGQGSYSPQDIKFLRLGSAAAHPQLLQKVQGVDKVIPKTSMLVDSLLD